MTSNRILSVMLLGIVLVAGCAETDHYKEVARVAEKAADRQAEQNAEMGRVNREVAAGTRRMVEADAEARKEIVAVHSELQSERAALNTGFDKLEAERKQIAGQRRTESVLVPAVKLLGGACLAIAVLVFCIALIRGQRHDGAIEAELNELLIQDLVSEQPRLRNLRDTAPLLEDQSPPEKGDSAHLTDNS